MTTLLIETMQNLARNEWKENAFPVIQNGRLVEWNRYYYDAGDLYIKILQAKTEGLGNEDYDAVYKKVDDYRIKKIYGRIILRAPSQDNYVCRVMLANGEHHQLQDKYVRALCQDSPVFDQLFQGRPESVQIENMTKDDMELLLAYAYGEEYKGVRNTIKAAALGTRFSMHEVLRKAQFVLVHGIERLDYDNFTQFEWACKVYPFFLGEHDRAEQNLFFEYFSKVLSKCNPETFKMGMQKLNEIGLTSFKLRPQEDGYNNERARLLIDELKCIEILDLSCLSDLEPKSLDNIGNLNRLRGLYLNGCDRMDDMVLEKLSDAKVLSDLFISGKLLTDQGLARLDKLSNLRQIVIFGPSDISDEGVRSFDHLEKLERLKLTNCDKVTRDALIALKVPYVSDRFLKQQQL